VTEAAGELRTNGRRRALGWQIATLVDSRPETPTARTLALDVPGWTGHLAGQHLDVRLTAEDGYSAQRSYSIASAPDGSRIEITVQAVRDGEVSPYLLEDFAVGDSIELRGPVGRWFAWRPTEPAPVLLVAGGSGIVPLMAMVRTRRATGSRVPFRLIYSVRSPGDLIYADELIRRTSMDGLDTRIIYTRTAPDGDRRGPGRVTADDLVRSGWPPDLEPRSYVCGPSGFVEAVADLLVSVGHDPAEIRTERFGPTS
jgi:ferredoxin-NADP reductase